MNRAETRWLGQVLTRNDGVRDGRVLVACSGGGDSMALLAFLWAARRSLGLELVVAHAHHGLRPEAQAEADLVRAVCRNADLDLVEAGFDVRARAEATGQGLETTARELRWAWLNAEAESLGALAVATGHTLDDHTETVLVRLARCGGTGCLTPLPARQGLRWSPLVEARREDLRAYLRKRGIPWAEDASNQEPFTPRNRWRSLLGPMRAEAPALDAHLWETHLQVEELEAFRDRQVQAWRGTRWDLSGEGIALAAPWEEADLRFALSAAFQALDWPREADLLRDLAAWLGPVLARRRRRPAAWGRFRLAPGDPLPWR
ncbi:MAG TPA: tRNA lysidine(34) synthetase TilS, partial [Holophaga sp.]|nr:tRNA lysidine(34) synthetase TilS [Holophaga sp.]